MKRINGITPGFFRSEKNRVLHMLHKIAGYCFDLAQELNRYYEKTPISSAEDIERSARLWMIERADYVLARALDLLGIEIPSKM